MKKKINAIVPALGALILLTAAYGVITWRQKEVKTPAPKDGTLYMMELEGIASLSWDKDGAGLSFTQEDTTWYYEGDRDFPVRQYAISSLADSLSRLTASRKLEGAGPLSSYGLDSPVLRYDITAKDGTKHAILIGDPVPGSDKDGAAPEYYACLSGDSQVYTIGSYLTDTAMRGLYDFLETETLPYISGADIKEITVTSQGASSHFIKKTEDETNIAWYKNSADSEANRLPDNAQLNNLAESVSGLSITSCAVYKATEQELAGYGLADPSMILSWTYEKGEAKESVTLSIGRLNDDGDGYYVRKNDSKAVNLISKEAGDKCLNAEYPR